MLIIHRPLSTYSLNVTINSHTNGQLLLRLFMFLFKIVTSVFEIVFYLIAGGGSTGAAPEQTPDLLIVWIAKGATTALLPPGLLGGGGGGGDRPIPRGQLANATGQLRGTVQISKPHKHTPTFVLSCIRRHNGKKSVFY